MKTHKPQIDEPHKPTKARVVPMKIKRWTSFSATNDSPSESKLAYSNSTSQQLARLVLLSRSTTRAWFCEVVSPQHVRFAFGQGCDHSSYVSHSLSKCDWQRYAYDAHNELGQQISQTDVTSMKNLVKKCQQQCQQTSSVRSKIELKKVGWSYR